MSTYKEGDAINNRYILKKFIGRGTYGEVWRAYDNILEQDFAIKLYVSLDDRGREEFTKEYKTAYGLHHPNLLTADHYDVWNNRPYLVMEFCENGASDKLVGNISETDLWRFIHDVASGLAYLHSLEPEPIIHQDIKPENVLINNSNSFVISDFGISLNMRSTMMKQSGRSSNMTGGAIAYMGPERFSSQPTPIKASDIWSLGASIYELATGELPFCGLGGSMLKNGAEMPSLPPQWSDNLNRLVQACMAKDTWDRPTAQQLADYADAQIKGVYVPDPVWLPVVGPIPTPAPDPIPTPAPDPVPTHPKKWWLIAPISVAAALAVFFATAPSRSLKKAADEHYAAYQECYDSCYDQIARGDGSLGENDILLKAKENYDSLIKYEASYASVSTDYNLSSNIQESIEKKLDKACDEWLAAARRQLESDDKEGAVLFYHTALQFKDSEDKHIPSLDKYASMDLGIKNNTVDPYVEPYAFEEPAVEPAVEPVEEAVEEVVEEVI